MIHFLSRSSLQLQHVLKRVTDYQDSPTDIQCAPSVPLCIADRWRCVGGCATEEKSRARWEIGSVAGGSSALLCQESQCNTHLCWSPLFRHIQRVLDGDSLPRYYRFPYFSVLIPPVTVRRGGWCRTEGMAINYTSYPHNRLRQKC